MNKRLITINDLARIHVPSDPQMAPDGSRVAFVLKTTDVDKNKYRAHLHVVDMQADADGNFPIRQLTRSQES